MPQTAIPTPAQQEPEIVVIPEKFYGAALKARIQEAKEEKPAGSGRLDQPPKRGHLVPIIIGIVVLVLAIGGVYFYLNSGLLFPAKPVPTPVVEQPKPTPTPTPQPPSAPSDLVATSTNPQSTSLSWIDTATNESGFRVERAEDGGNFQSLTSVPPNSTSFQDVAVVAGKTYRYRVIALNQSGESTPSTEASATVPTPPPVVEVPKLPPAGLDTDSDGLSDVEEALYGTNSRKPDTDGDGFLDGNEVFHLYNPNGRAPGKLIEAGLVKEVKGSVGWTMLIPTSWTLKLTNEDGSQAVIETGHPETFTVAVKDNPQSLPIVQWYMADHPDVQESQILQYRSKKGYEGIIGPDLLTTYIPWGNKVFVFTYGLNGQPFINYRTTYSMMLNSLVLTGLPQITTPVAGATLPFEPAATTTGVIAQPESIFPSAGVTPTSTENATSTLLTP